MITSGKLEGSKPSVSMDLGPPFKSTSMVTPFVSMMYLAIYAEL